MIEKVVEVSNVTKTYGKKENETCAISDVSFSIVKGEFIGIMGPSGSGKTTLLNCIATIDKISTGKIIVNHVELNQLSKKKTALFRRKELGFIFQDFNLLDTLTAYENIAMALTIQRIDADLINTRVVEMAARLEIKKILSKYPYQLSGGEQQRTACARALICNPSLLLADEPTGALDSNSSRALLESFEKINQELRSTILLVTHDAYSASYCNRILFIKDGKVYGELKRDQLNREIFYEQITEVMKKMSGGE